MKFIAPTTAVVAPTSAIVKPLAKKKLFLISEPPTTPVPCKNPVNSPTPYAPHLISVLFLLFLIFCTKNVVVTYIMIKIKNTTGIFTERIAPNTEAITDTGTSNFTYFHCILLRNTTALTIEDIVNRKSPKVIAFWTSPVIPINIGVIIAVPENGAIMFNRVSAVSTSIIIILMNTV